MESATSITPRPSDGQARPLQAVFAIDPVELRRVIVTELYHAKQKQEDANHDTGADYWEGYADCAENFARWLQALEGPR